MIGFYSFNNSIYANYRIQKDNKSISLKYFPGIKDEGWNKTTRRFKDDKLNNRIVSIEKAIIDVVNANDPLKLNSKTFSALINERLIGKVKKHTSFFDYCDTYLIDRNRSIKITIKELRLFNPDLTFEGIDKVFYRNFMQHLKAQNQSLNYTGLHIKNLKAILNHATDTGINTNLTFKEFKKPSENVFNVYLNEQEIAAIYNLRITEQTALDLQKESNPNMSSSNIKNMVESLDNARKLFVIGCCTGLRADNYLDIDPNLQIDLIKGFIHVIAKGSVKLKIPLHKFVREIVESGEFPKPVSQSNFNKSIKVLGKLASEEIPSLKENVIYTRSEGNTTKEYSKPKYKLIKSHTARRSFCSILFMKGVPIQYIMAISGHKRETTFRKYIAQVSKDILTEKLIEYDVWGK